MNNFIPANSRIAIRSTKANSTPQWYTTKTDVDVPANVQTVRCPIREDRDVLSFTHQGFDLFFLAGQVRVRVSATEMTKLNGVRMMELNYDIHGGRFPAEDGHPSTWLWNYGARESESCWMIPEYNIDKIMERLNRLTEVGATWGCKPYDPAETAKLVGLCVQAIRREIEATVSSAAASRDRAQQELDATPAEDDPNAAIKKFEDTAKRIQKNAEVKLERLKNTMSVFGLSGSHFATQSAASTIAATRFSMKERARLFVAARDALAALGTDQGTAAAASMTDGEMPAEIAADLLQDNDVTALAETVRAAFIGEPETFSLVDGNDDDGVATEDETPVVEVPAPAAPVAYTPAVGDNVIVARGVKVPVGTTARIIMLRNGNFGMSAMIGYGQYNTRTRRWAQTEWVPAKNLDQTAA